MSDYLIQELSIGLILHVCVLTAFSFLLLIGVKMPFNFRELPKVIKNNKASFIAFITMPFWFGGWISAAAYGLPDNLSELYKNYSFGLGLVFLISLANHYSTYSSKE